MVTTRIKKFVSSSNRTKYFYPRFFLVNTERFGNPFYRNFSKVQIDVNYVMKAFKWKTQCRISVLAH